MSLRFFRRSARNILSSTIMGSALLVTTVVPAQTPKTEDAARAAFKSGLEAFNQKQFDVAADRLAQVPELGGYLSIFKHWYLGQAYIELGKYKESEPELAKVITSPASRELKYQAQFLLGDVALRQRQHALVLSRLRPLERKWRRSYRYPEVLHRMMVAEFRLNQMNAACHTARKLYSKFGAHALVRDWGSDLGAVEIDSKHLPCQVTRAEFSQRIRNLQWSGESEKARKEITDILAKTPENQRLELDLVYATFLVNEGSTDEAMSLLIKYYPQQKGSVQFLALLGKAAARSGEYQTAVGAYERIHSLSPTSRKGREALYQAAYLSYQFQDYDGAVRKFQKFVKMNPQSGLARDAQWHLAWLQYLRSDYDGAIERFEQASRSANSRRRRSRDLMDKLLYWTGMAHYRNGNLEKAKESLVNLIAKDPNSYYGLAAQARLEVVLQGLGKSAPRIPATLETAGAEIPAPPKITPEEESEEELAESEVKAEAPEAEEEGAIAGDDDEHLQPSLYADPALRARIDVAQKLKALGLTELVRWELLEVERRTRNPQYLKMLISSYEGIESFNRSAVIADLNFAREREKQGITNGRALWESAFPRAYLNSVQKYSSQYSVASEWVWSIMRAESMFRTDVISPVGARGLMQLMTYTARNLNKLAGDQTDEAQDLLNPDTNIKLGAQYLGRLGKMFRGQLPLVAASYNAGPHRVESWLVNFGHLDMDEFVEHIPFLETRNYVKKVVRHNTFYRRLYAKDQAPVNYLVKGLGVPIPSRASTKETWERL